MPCVPGVGSIIAPCYTSALMGANEIAVLRDVLVIAAAAALIVAAVFGMLVTWQLWRLLQDARHDAGPVIQALTGTVQTVRDTLRYAKDKLAMPAADGVAAVRLTGEAATGSLGARLRRFNAALKGERSLRATPSTTERKDI